MNHANCLKHHRLNRVDYCLNNRWGKYESSTLEPSFTTVVRNQLQTPEGLRLLQQHLGPLGQKYINIIAPLVGAPLVSNKILGKGLLLTMMLTDNKIDYVHWNDPNELVDRLRLLESSRQAGNNAHDNEILSIIEELREAGIIIN